MANNWVFCDLETVDDRPSSGILSMGIVAVDLAKNLTFEQLQEQGVEVKFDIKDQLRRGWTKGKDTMEWWKKQGAEAQRVLAPKDDDVKIDELPKIIEQYLKGCGLKINGWTFYASRGTFDYPILENTYFKLGYVKDSWPWKFYRVRELRSMLHGMVGAESGKIDLPEGMLNGFIEHNALHDACADVLRMQYAFKMAMGEE